MSEPSFCRRRQARLDVSDDERFRIEFAYPDPGGSVHSLQLRDLSLGGMSFLADDGPGGLEFGSHVEKATVRLGDRTMHGDFVVIHVTVGDRGETVCGVLFYPSTDADVTVLKDVMTGER
jgi:hypothetical protein